MKRKGEQFHPSRDVRDEGGQQQLFDPEAHEAEQRLALGRKRFLPNDADARNIRDQALRETVIPTSHLQSRPKVAETEISTNLAGSLPGAAGSYTGPASFWSPDRINVDAYSQGYEPTHVFTHEAGHRQHLGVTTGMSPTNHPAGVSPDPLKEGVADAYADRYGGSEDVHVQAMRDDITDGRPKFMSYGDPHAGYSTNPDRARDLGWTSDDRALYAATRAHASETGEQPYYVQRGHDVRESVGHGDPSIDATLHGLMSSAPHAAQALKDTGLKDVGDAAVRRHRDRQLLTQGQSVQLGMFQELRGDKTGKAHGYVPNWEAAHLDENDDQSFSDFFEGPGGLHPTIAKVSAASGESVTPQHMSHNQFGEKPRTSEDVRESIGVYRNHARKAGFPVEDY